MGARDASFIEEDIIKQLSSNKTSFYGNGCGTNQT